ncbi:MAG: DUF3179 domain-containing protein [Planctomycetes bacterium]|nr:DUF3179 domain-containing protein [Planctomycetota bacterium]
MSEGAPTGSPTLTFRSGGWVIALAGVLVLAILAWAFAGIFLGHHPKGDGQSVASYGFELGNLQTRGGALVASGNPRDFLLPLDRPKSIAGHDMLAYNAKLRSKFVVTADRVIGVEIGGQSRAYPLNLMNVHEIVNDELAGVPIAVTFSPLCDAAIVFDRRVGGATLDFGVSGLLLDSNLVMYDKSSSGAPSLWSQMGEEAIAGPAAGTKLVEIPNVNVCTWKHWLAEHPATEVILPDPQDEQRMKTFSYSRYLLSPRVDFPIGRMSRPDAMPDKMPIIAITAGGETRVVTLREAADRGGDAPWSFAVGGVPVVVTSQKEPASVLIRAADGTPIQVTPCLSFAWEAFHSAAASDQVRMPSQSVK